MSEINTPQWSKATKIIAFCGYSQAGKSSLAKLLGTERLSFAAPIRKTCYQVMGYGSKETTPEGFTISRRKFMQIFGKALRDKCPSFWTDVWFKKYANNFFFSPPKGRGIVVVEDLRYPNEAKLIKSLGGTIYLVVRGKNTPRWYKEIFLHSSEKASRLFPWVDEIIYNPGNDKKAALKEAARNILEGIKSND